MKGSGVTGYELMISETFYISVNLDMRKFLKLANSGI